MPFVVRAPSKYSTKELLQFVERRFRQDFRLEILNATRRISTQMKNDLAQTTATWTNHEVTWKTKTDAGIPGKAGGTLKDNPASLVFAEGDTGLWQSIDEGMTVYGRGSNDYAPKTTPGVFKSGRGSGYWNSSVNQVNNVEPREWTKRIMNEYDDRFDKELGKALDNFIRKFSQAAK